MANQWFKFYGSDWLMDLKVQDLSAMDRVCFVGLLCFASQSELPLNEIKDFTEKRFIKVMAFGSQEEIEGAKGFSTRLKDLGMITLTKTGSVIIPQFSKRQERALTPYERLKKHRNKKKMKDILTNDNGDNANDNDRIEENRIDKRIHTPNEEVIEIQGMEFEEALNHPESLSEVVGKISGVNNQYSEKFKVAWELYPLKVGKMQSNTLFEKQCEADQDAIITDLPRRKKTKEWLKNFGEFIPHFTTYIRNRRWEDEIKMPHKLVLASDIIL